MVGNKAKGQTSQWVFRPFALLPTSSSIILLHLLLFYFNYFTSLLINFEIHPDDH